MNAFNGVPSIPGRASQTFGLLIQGKDIINPYKPQFWTLFYRNFIVTFVWLKAFVSQNATVSELWLGSFELQTLQLPWQASRIPCRRGQTIVTIVIIISTVSLLWRLSEEKLLLLSKKKKKKKEKKNQQPKTLMVSSWPPLRLNLSETFKLDQVSKTIETTWKPPFRTLVGLFHIKGDKCLECFTRMVW